LSIFSKILRSLLSRLDAQARLRKDEFVANAPMTKSVRIGGALIPLISFFIVVFQVYSSANERTILSSAGVQQLDSWNWTVSSYESDLGDFEKCLQNRCYLSLPPAKQEDRLQIPSGDPVIHKRWPLQKDTIVVYRTQIDSTRLLKANMEILYIAGIRAERMAYFVDGQQVMTSPGGLPYFLPLPRRADGPFVEIEIVTWYKPALGTNGFIKDRQLIAGTTRSVLIAHNKLMARSFPRQAVVIFLLSIGALTFAFFVFLDHKRELFALGLTISLLGAALSAWIGILGFLGTNTFFVMFTMHMTALAWYGTELLRISVGLPKRILSAGGLVLLAYFASVYGMGDSGRPLRYGLLIFLDTVPLLVSPLLLGTGAVLYNRSKERSVQLLLSAFGMIAYSVYLMANDLKLEELNWLREMVQSLNEIPLLFIVTTWIVSALSSLGSLEKRVQLAVADREQRLKLEHEIVLAEEVQKSFISSGMQNDDVFDVCTIYQAVKKVGGDWVTWQSLGDRFKLGIIGDVVGKGVQAGLIVSACDSILRRFMKSRSTWGSEITAEQVIRELVDDLHAAVVGAHEKRAMTIMIVVLDREGGVTFTSMGHPPLVKLKKDASEILTTRNSWLSRDFVVANLKVGTTNLGEGETLVGYTDGVCDGSRQLRQFRNKIAPWYGYSLKQIETEMMAIIPDYDDQTLLLIRTRMKNDAAEVVPTAS
jgi:hypothetical protein